MKREPWKRPSWGISYLSAARIVSDSSKETYIHEKRPIKKIDWMYIAPERSTNGLWLVKGDVYIWKEKYQKNILMLYCTWAQHEWVLTRQKRPVYIYMKRDLEKRPTYSTSHLSAVRMVSDSSKESYIYEKRTIKQTYAFYFTPERSTSCFRPFGCESRDHSGCQTTYTW